MKLPQQVPRGQVERPGQNFHAQILGFPVGSEMVFVLSGLLSRAWLMLKWHCCVGSAPSSRHPILLAIPCDHCLIWGREELCRRLVHGQCFLSRDRDCGG